MNGGGGGEQTEITIRAAVDKDVPMLASLITELGYPTTVDEMTERYRQVAGRDDYRTFVAVAEGRVVGMIGAYLGYYYEKNGAIVRILALVVDQAYRSYGVGASLLQHVENWATAQGAAGVALNSGLQRQNAHRFYRRHGYREKTLGFYKDLDGN